jgi:hypothetical protein
VTVGLIAGVLAFLIGWLAPVGIGLEPASRWTQRPGEDANPANTAGAMRLLMGWCMATCEAIAPSMLITTPA